MNKYLGVPRWHWPACTLKIWSTTLLSTTNFMLCFSGTTNTHIALQYFASYFKVQIAKCHRGTCSFFGVVLTNWWSSVHLNARTPSYWRCTRKFHMITLGVNYVELISSLTGAITFNVKQWKCNKYDPWRDEELHLSWSLLWCCDYSLSTS